MSNLLLADDWYDDDWYGEDEPYYVIEVLLPKISGFLSLIGSLIIMAEIIVDHRAKKGSAIKRVIFNLSLGDSFSSFAFFLSSWPAPRHVEVARVWNVGNEATCSAQGFILQMGMVAAPIFNVILAWCQYSVITKGVREHQLQRYEKYFYGIVWSLALSFSIVLLSLEMYNASYFICGIGSYPYTCTQSWWADDESPADCIRGDNSFVALLATTGLVWISIVWVIVLLVKTIRSVNKTERRIMRRTFRSSTIRSERRLDGGRNASVVRTSNPDLWRTRMMRQHTYRYIAAFLITYFLFTFQLITFQFINHPVISPILAIVAVLTLPLQGFLNFLVFSENQKMKTAAGRILKKIMYGIFQRCCCWGNGRSTRREFQRSDQRGSNDAVGNPDQGNGTPANGNTGANDLKSTDNIQSDQSLKHAEGGRSESNDGCVSKG